LHESSALAIVLPLQFTKSVSSEGRAMSRCMGMVCAGAVLLAGAGCPLQSFLTMPGGPVCKQVVPGLPGQVAATLETGLTDAGIHVVRKRLDAEVRLAGQAKSGKVFCLDVKREKADGGPTTAVTVRWGSDPDEQLWQLVVTILTAPAPEEEASDPS
jgi:hypothetical protein